jgi:hypothetical protein
MAAGRFRAVNAPVPVVVRLGSGGTPSAVVWGGRAYDVATVQERWRIDEGWWWERPVSRLYWQLVLIDGRLITVYQDLLDKTWWAQRA